jgi:hypothetical protein
MKDAMFRRGNLSLTRQIGAERRGRWTTRIARHTRNSYVGLPTFPRSGLGTESGKPNYVIIYGEGCFNSKRQAQRTVELHNKYRSRVHFVVIDLDI